MSNTACFDLKRLEKQIYLLSPTLHKFNEAGKDKIRRKLYDQLQFSRPKVVLEKYHVHKLLVNIEKNFQKCKDFGIIQTSNEAYENFQKQNQLMDVKDVQLSEQSDNEDDNIKPVVTTKRPMPFSPDRTPRSECDNDLPLAIRKESRKRIHRRITDEYETSHSQSSYASSRKRSYTILSNEASEQGNINKNDSVDTQVTLTISLPSILRESTDNNLEISVDFGKIDLARQVLDQRIRRISDNETNVSNVDRKTDGTGANNLNTQQNHEGKEVTADDEALSCLISEVLVEPNSTETWRATAALENINNNVGDNYNSNIAVQRRWSIGTERIAPTQFQKDVIKKPRKRTIKVKDTSAVPKGPPKKRGRKPGQKYEKKMDSEKSDLAKYVELFSNNCEFPCTTASTTLPSTMSQMVTSTTQNYEDPQRTANETQTAQISYLINGEWTNGGICQLISPGNVGNIGLDTGHITQEDFSLNTPFEDFVNYIDSSNNDVGNNEIARVLDGNNVAPSTCSNIVDVSNIVSFQTQSSSADNLRKVPSSACNADMQKLKRSIPPPAHNFESGILDLSLKSELFSTIILEEEKEPTTSNCEPIDLSMKTKNDENLQKGTLQLIQGEDESDDLFLRRLIDNSDFDYKDINSNQNCDSTERNDLLFEPILDANDSFKAALDMPLLDNDESTLAVKQDLDEIQESDKQQTCLDNLTENYSDNKDIAESTQSKVRDLNTPPPLTFIQIQDNAANLFPTLKENYQTLAETEVDNFELDNIVPLQDEVVKSDENKIIDDLGTPPIMSLISKSDDFSNNTQSRCNAEIITDTMRIENCTTSSGDRNNLDINKNKQAHLLSNNEISIVANADNDTYHIITPQQLESVGIIINTKSDIDSKQIDTVEDLTNVNIKINASETNDTLTTNIKNELNENSLNEKLLSNTNVPDIKSLENNNDTNDILDIQEKIEDDKDNKEPVNSDNNDTNDILDIQDKTEDDKNNKEPVNSANNDTNNIFGVQEATEDIKDNKETVKNDNNDDGKNESMQVDLVDTDRISSVEKIGNITQESVKTSEESTKLETNYTLPETDSNCTIAENSAMESDVKDSINASDKTFVAKVKESIEVEFNEQPLHETCPENLESKCKEINDLVEDSSKNIQTSSTTVQNNDCRLLEVVLERNVTKSPILMNDECINKEREQRIFENVNNVQFAETQVASYNLNTSGEIVTEIEDVKLCLKIDNEEKKSEFKKQKSASKLQIISVVSIDSFIHTNEDDNEFIRRTLKNHANIQNIEELNIKNFQIPNNEHGKETKESIAIISEDCCKMNAIISEEYSNIKKEEEVGNGIEEFQYNTLHEVVAIVPEEVTKIFDQDIDIKSEALDAIDINNTLKISKIKQNETITVNTCVEMTEFKKEPNNVTETPDNTLDVLKEESCIIDLSVSCKNIEIDITEKPTDDIKSHDMTMEIKAFNTKDEISDLSILEKNSNENTINDKETSKSEIIKEYPPERYHDDEPKCFTTQNQTLSILVSEDSSTTMSNTESSDFSEDLKQQPELTVEDNNKTTLFSFGQTTERSNIMTTVPKDALCHNHKSNLFLSNLSLLEMEEKFDETLDFDNHLEDDVLSLATSCFNSPDDDRFGNSKLLDETDDADMKPIFVNSTEDPPSKPEFVEIVIRPQMKEEIDEAEVKEFPADPLSTLTKFKIPKLGASQTTNQFIQQTNEAQPIKRIELDKITRTVQNVCAVPPLPLQPAVMCSAPNTSMLVQRKHDLFSNTTGNGLSCVITLDQKVDCESFAKDVLVHNHPNYVNMSRGQFAGRGGEAMNSGAAIIDIAKIFGPTCLPFLVDKCSVLGNTQHNHQLRDATFVQMALEGLPKSELNTAYKFMFNHSKLFRRYFFVFCSVYSKHNNRSKLLNMVYDCEKQSGCVLLLRNIFYSLIECGFNKINACRQILSRSRDRSSATIDVLVGIIFEADWGMFCDYLEGFAQMPHYSYRINLLSEMAARVLRTKDTRLSSVVCKCLLTLNQDDYKLVNRTPNLIALLELMKDGKVC